MNAVDDFEIRSRNGSEIVHVDVGEESIGFAFGTACCAGTDLEVVVGCRCEDTAGSSGGGRCRGFCNGSGGDREEEGGKEGDG